MLIRTGKYGLYAANSTNAGLNEKVRLRVGFEQHIKLNEVVHVCDLSAQ